MTSLWLRFGYRPWARLLHRLSLHHTRRIGPMEDGAIIHKCEWCGVSRADRPMDSIRLSVTGRQPTIIFDHVKGEVRSDPPAGKQS
jgi:hypothetical protein